MNINPNAHVQSTPLAAGPPDTKSSADFANVVARTGPDDQDSLRDAFDAFVGQTFYGLLLKSMRTMVDKPSYFHGGRAEEMFQSQLDQVLTEEMSKANAHQLTGPMFELFQLPRPA